MWPRGIEFVGYLFRRKSRLFVVEGGSLRWAPSKEIDGSESQRAWDALLLLTYISYQHRDARALVSPCVETLETLVAGLCVRGRNAGTCEHEQGVD